jgi:hypothetical protein
LKATIGENKYLHLDPDTATAILYNILFKTFTGEGVFRRALQIDAHNMDWLNSPVGDTEQLHGRIGRLGPYGPVLLDGPFETNLESTWSDIDVIDESNISDPTYIQLRDGELRIAYKNITFSSYLVEKIYNFDTLSWDDYFINEASSSYPTYIQLQDEELRVAYIRNSDFYLVERIYNFTTSTWGSETTINEASSSYPTYIQLQDEELRVAYRRDADGYLVERIYNFTTSTWGSETTINEASSSDPTYIQLQDEELRVAYQRDTDSYLVERIYNFTTSTWGDESSINEDYSYEPTYIQLQDGELRIAYRSSDNDLVERRLQRYARLGAGVIESGHNANGYYQLESDGTLRMWVAIQSPVANTNTALDMPYTPYNTVGGANYTYGNVTMSYAPVVNNSALHQAWCDTNGSGAFNWHYYIGTSQPIYLTFVGRWRA